MFINETKRRKERRFFLRSLSKNWMQEGMRKRPFQRKRHEMDREREKRGSEAKRPWNWTGAITIRVPSRVGVFVFFFFVFFELGRDGTLGKGNQCVTQK